MKTLIKILTITFIIYTHCNAQDKNLPIGKYYNIENTGIKAQFGDTPNISADIENEFIRTKEYRYAYPKSEDDINLLYAIAINKLKNDTLFKEQNKKVNYLSSLIKISYENFFGGSLVKEENSEFKKRYCVKQKMKIFFKPQNKEIIVNSVYFNYKDLVIRAYVFSPIDKDNNNRIAKFFETIILENETLSKEINDETVYTVVPMIPQFGDKKEALQEYIQKESKLPTSLSKTSTSKNVFIKVIIEKDGKVKFYEILKGVDKKFDSEAKRIVENMPNWTPGQLEGGKKTRTYMTFPIWFE